MSYNKILKVIFVTLFCFTLNMMSAKISFAVFIDIQEAQDIAENWLMHSKGLILDGMGGEIREVVHYHGGIHGEPGYYMFFLAPQGWIAIPADDRLEVIRAFGSGSITSKDYENSPMPHFLRVD